MATGVFRTGIEMGFGLVTVLGGATLMLIGIHPRAIRAKSPATLGTAISIAMILIVAGVAIVLESRILDPPEASLRPFFVQHAIGLGVTGLGSLVGLVGALIMMRHDRR